MDIARTSDVVMNVESQGVKRPEDRPITEHHTQIWKMICLDVIKLQRVQLPNRRE